MKIRWLIFKNSIKNKIAPYLPVTRKTLVKMMTAHEDKILTHNERMLLDMVSNEQFRSIIQMHATSINKHEKYVKTLKTDNVKLKATIKEINVILKCIPDLINQLLELNLKINKVDVKSIENAVKEGEMKIAHIVDKGNRSLQERIVRTVELSDQIRQQYISSRHT
jgi:hypothetical protein